VGDQFMQGVEKLVRVDEDVKYEPKYNNAPEHEVPLSTQEVWAEICDSVHQCGDPGLQFDDTVNFWNTCASTGRINATNPCGEFHFLDHGACNLASINLLKFLEEGEFDFTQFARAAEVLIIAQDLLIDEAAYPTESIRDVALDYRPLGLGYTNLGALIMSMGLGYDSDEARALTAAITSHMTATAYNTSAYLAAAKTPFAGYKTNRDDVMRVLKQHYDAATQFQASEVLWKETLALVEEYGVRNSQVTLLAPTGTISFMMDCVTTGIEPEIGLNKVKHLVGGGTVQTTNPLVSNALAAMGYSEDAVAPILKRFEDVGHFEDAGLPPAHLGVFDCATQGKGTRHLSVDAHISMMAVAQPFLSGGISKTINLPQHASLEDISHAHLLAWKKGLKSVIVYRDGSRSSQPLVTDESTHEHPVDSSDGYARKKLLDHHDNAHRIRIEFGNYKMYVIVTPYYDTQMPGEVFITIAKEGSTVKGLTESWSQMMSYALQSGIPLDAVVKKFAYMKFEPSGFSSDPDLGFVHSIPDAVARKLSAIFLGERRAPTPNGEEKAAPPPTTKVVRPALSTPDFMDGPPCPECGNVQVRRGNCHTCTNCGGSSGCGG